MYSEITLCIGYSPLWGFRHSLGVLGLTLPGIMGNLCIRLYILLKSYQFFFLSQNSICKIPDTMDPFRHLDSYVPKPRWDLGPSLPFGKLAPGGSHTLGQWVADVSLRVQLADSLRFADHAIPVPAEVALDNVRGNVSFQQKFIFQSNGRLGWSWGCSLLACGPLETGTSPSQKANRCDCVLPNT